jgi:hypothetical protein
MIMSDKREAIIEFIETAQAQAKEEFTDQFCNRYGQDAILLAEDIANEIFGNQAGQTQKIFAMLAEYDPEFLHKMVELGEKLIDNG